ncbi:MAG: hypothetical protein IJO89_00145 [Clostridia bacterium]|nr:hypothetical protein [Clostridia bacterium]MBQ9957437.1 hypothetical protein [Clostridia bacterium]
MTNGQILHTLFEGLMIILLIIGFIFEDKLVAFEERIIQRHKQKRRKSAKAKIIKFVPYTENTNIAK